MDQVTATIINKALDGLQARQMHTANNIANANTQGFRPMRVSFEESLRAAAAEGGDAVRAVRPDVRLAPAGGLDGEMRLDMEVATASQTAMRYGALIEVLGRQMAMARAVVSGGGR